MTDVAILPDRGVVSVTGVDAEKLLGGLITNDTALLGEAPSSGGRGLYAGLLSPQGKILFDFLITKTDGGFLLDTARERAPELVKRLGLYKLRAAVAIKDRSAEFSVGAVWGDALALSNVLSRIAGRASVFADPRHPGLGLRVLAEQPIADDVLAAIDGATATPEAYQAHRIGLGIPEGGRDFAFGDTFPHEALFDQINGVSFTKGCYVGQEVVSRMQHKTSIRKRVVMVAADVLLPAGPLPVLAGEVEIGRLGSVADREGLALMRLDRVAEAELDGVAITAGGVALRFAAPSFATFGIGAPHEIA